MDLGVTTWTAVHSWALGCATHRPSSASQQAAEAVYRPASPVCRLQAGASVSSLLKKQLLKVERRCRTPVLKKELLERRRGAAGSGARPLGKAELELGPPAGRRRLPDRPADRTRRLVEAAITTQPFNRGASIGGLERACSRAPHRLLQQGVFATGGVCNRGGRGRVRSAAEAPTGRPPRRRARRRPGPRPAPRAAKPPADRPLRRSPGETAGERTVTLLHPSLPLCLWEVCNRPPAWAERTVRMDDRT